MSFTTEEKIDKLRRKGWVISRFQDSEGTQKISAKFYEPVGRGGNKKAIALYNLIFNNQNDLVREVYYSSVGTQKDLAKEYGLSPEEISYIKQDNKYYTRTDKELGLIKVQINSGRLVKCSEDIRLFLSQIQTRPYSIKVRKELLDETECRTNVETMCNILSQRTGNHFFAEYLTEDGKKPMCTIYSGNAFPVYRAPEKNYLEIYSFLQSAFLLTHQYKSPSEINIIQTITNL